MQNEAQTITDSCSRNKFHRNVFEAFDSSTSDRGCCFGGQEDECCSEHADDLQSPEKVITYQKRLSLPIVSLPRLQPTGNKPKLNNESFLPTVNKEMAPFVFDTYGSIDTDEVIDIVRSSPSKPYDAMATKNLSCSEIPQGDESGQDWQRVFDDRYNPEMPIEHSYNLSEAHVWPRCAVCSMFRVNLFI